ncbi:hypothetical protein [Roseomonas sp. 18066]|uniref:hypothetical protein n=1 Tax=Roseomonas sp. 18066 TaxID=2681412 RepID=UPI001357AABF|nr:hypothetical protein [Roseomonas sp. 18066]
MRLACPPPGRRCAGWWPVPPAAASIWWRGTAGLAVTDYATAGAVLRDGLVVPLAVFSGARLAGCRRCRR